MSISQQKRLPSMSTAMKSAFVLSVILVGGWVPAADFTPAKQVRIVLVGDSTVASYPRPPADRPDLTGWGQVLSEFFTDRVMIMNRAVSGRSSKSFIHEGHWKKSLAEKPDYVFIQFGHNDGPGKGPDRATDAAGDYRDYLRQYLAESRAIGAKPILVTPVARRLFPIDPEKDSLTPYVNAMKAVAAEEHVPLIDLHRTSSELFKTLGDEGSADLTASATDRTHFSRKGGMAMAQLIVDQLPAAEPALAAFLKPDAVKTKTP